MVLQRFVPHSIRRRLALAGSAALTLASLPATAEPAQVAQGSASDLGVMSIQPQGHR